MKGTNYAARHDAGAFSAPVCLVRRTGKQNMKKEKAGRECACRRMQALFSSGFCAINPISGSKKNGFFQSGGHGASIPRRRHRRDSVHLGRH